MLYGPIPTLVAAATLIVWVVNGSRDIILVLLAAENVVNTSSELDAVNVTWYPIMSPL